jgi:hypothetical protein
MSDLAHVPGQRIQLSSGQSLQEVFAGALKHGGAQGSPPAAQPLGSNEVRKPAELQAVIDEARIPYADCSKLSVSLDWWNCDSNDSAWQVTEKPNGPRPA